MQQSAGVIDRPTRPGISRTVLFGAALVGLLVAWMPTSYSMVRRWMGAQGYYSHGLLIPLISAYLIWMRREDLKQAPVGRSVWGLVPLAVGVVGQLASAYANVAFSSGFSMILVLIGLVWFVYGTAIFRLVAFPLCFLGFMVPLYMELLEQVSFPMKIGAAAASTNVLRGALGVQCDRVGNTLYFVHTQLEVGDPCSGLRSLIALMALGALVAYVSRLSLWRRLVLFLLSIPFALVSNVVRITVLALVAYRWGVEATRGDLVHYGTGFLVFFVAVVLLLGLWRVLRIGTPPPPKGKPGDWPEPLRRAAQVLLLVAVVKALVTLFLLEDVANRYVVAEHVACLRGVAEAEVPADAVGEHRSQIRLQRFARGTIDVNYVLFTLVGVVFLVRGLRWARRYLQGLALAGIAADVGFVIWLLWFEAIPIPAGVGLKPLLVSLHLVLYAGVSAASLLWTVGRLSDRRLRAAAGVGAAVEDRARGVAGRARAALILTALLAASTWWLIRPAPIEAGIIRARSVPAEIGLWVALQDSEPTPEVIETLETRDILSRLYGRPGSDLVIELSVVFSQHNRRATHPPEICLNGSGWQTDHRRRVTLDVPRGPGQPRTPFVELVSRRRPGERLLSFYSFKAGRHYTNDYLRQQWEILKMNLAGRAARGALVRFSAAATPDGREAARRALIDFMRIAMPLVEQALEGRAPASTPAASS